MYDESAEARNRKPFAISSTVPERFNGEFCSKKPSICFTISGPNPAFSNTGVPVVEPGDIALTRMFLRELGGEHANERTLGGFGRDVQRRAGDSSVGDRRGRDDHRRARAQQR